jgi:hypothetical protein
MESTWYVGHYLAYCTSLEWWMWSIWWNDNWQGKPKYSEGTCLSATLSTTNPTWPDLGSNPSRRGGKPATNRLSYGTACQPTLEQHKRRESIGTHDPSVPTERTQRGHWNRQVHILSQLNPVPIFLSGISILSHLRLGLENDYSLNFFGQFLY